MNTGNIEFIRGIYNITSTNKENTKIDYQLKSNDEIKEEPFYRLLLIVQML
ncbi:MAG: hypothetical protein K9I95_04535 [Flavobacteriaceae bacterium]|nr:hypothetical protein [Flavobacteriaceae bacterium]